MTLSLYRPRSFSFSSLASQFIFKLSFELDGLNLIMSREKAVKTPFMVQLENEARANQVRIRLHQILCDPYQSLIIKLSLKRHFRMRIKLDYIDFSFSAARAVSSERAEQSLYLRG